ncbi:hypothetical protein C8F01DRAFT_1170347 [Mycena amicta]|nr:hypothetical protein C8F01DRAFT_1170347 [Mycena amicta]
MASKAPQSRVLAALASLSLDASNVPKPLAPIFQRAPSAPAAIHPHPRKPQTLAPPLKATRSAPLPTKPITPATEAPLYSYKTISPAPRVRLARTEAQADTWVAELDLTGPISVDCEWVVSFHKGLGGGPRPVSLIQIADKRNVVLIQLRTTASSMTRFPRVLQRVLEDATIYKAGANILSTCLYSNRTRLLIVRRRQEAIPGLRGADGGRGGTRVPSAAG